MAQTNRPENDVPAAVMGERGETETQGQSGDAVAGEVPRNGPAPLAASPGALYLVSAGPWFAKNPDPEYVRFDLEPDEPSPDWWAECTMCGGQRCAYCDERGRLHPLDARFFTYDLRGALHDLDEIHHILDEEPSMLRQNEWLLACGEAARECMKAWGLGDPLLDVNEAIKE